MANAWGLEEWKGRVGGGGGRRTAGQGCWTRRQKNSTISSTRSSSPRHPLAENEYSIAGHWIDGQNTEHRKLVLWRWRRWLQALGLFYKKNMPNNNTAYSICKINLSFISFLWVDILGTFRFYIKRKNIYVCIWINPFQNWNPQNSHHPSLPLVSCQQWQCWGGEEGEGWRGQDRTRFLGYSRIPLPPPPPHPH